MAAPIQSRTRRAAANLRLAASSAVPVASGYEHGLRPCDAGFSHAARTTHLDGDRL